MPTVLYNCAFVPRELIAAHGLSARRLLPSAHDGLARDARPDSQGMCPYARAFLHAAAGQADAVIVTTACDQMRRGFELLAGGQTPCFLLNVPHTLGPAAAMLYGRELERLGQFLCRLGGPLDRQRLIDAMLQRRPQPSTEEIRASRPGANDTTMAGKLMGETPMLRRQASGRIALALTGGPAMEDGSWLEAMLSAGGAVIRLDASETGEMAQPHFDESATRRDPLGELARAYLAIPAVWQRPNEPLYRYLTAELPRRGVKGLILRRYTWCDGWHAEAARLRDTFSGLPMLDLDLGDAQQASIERARTRLEAFLELLHA